MPVLVSTMGTVLPAVPSLKRKCHDMVYTAVHSGVLKKPSICSKCGLTRKIHAHHVDYNKPLEVVWLCNSCHAFLHSQLTECTFSKKEFKEKHKLRLLGNQYAKGSIRSAEFRKGVSEFHKGKAHFAGGVHTPEVRLKIAEASRQMWKRRRESGYVAPRGWKRNKVII